MKTIGRSVFRGRGLAAFHEDRGGAVLMTFGLLLPVVLGLLVLVFSYSRASSYKSGLQSAADSAALATTAAVIANPSLTSDQQQALANLYFANNAPAGAASLGSLTVPTATNFNSTVTTTVQYQGRASFPIPRAAPRATRLTAAMSRPGAIPISTQRTARHIT